MSEDRNAPTLSITGLAPDADALRDRLASIRAELADHARRSSADRAGVGNPQWETEIAAIRPQPPLTHAGRRGQLAHAMKRVIRRVLYWYVEPSWERQGQLDRALAQRSDATIVRLDRLERDVEQLTYQVTRLGATTHELAAELARLRLDRSGADDHRHR